MIIYLDKNFNPVSKEKAVMAKVIPDNGKPPYFIAVEKKPSESIRKETK